METIQIIGMVGKDPLLETSKAGSKYTSFSLATNRKDRDGAKLTTWYNCTAFGKSAEILSQYVRKGSKLYITGDLVSSIGSGRDGKTYLNLDVTISKFEFIDSKPVQQATPAPAPGFAGGDDDVLF